jgi:glycerol uptake facilitator-like aquaporin
LSGTSPISDSGSTTDTIYGHLTNAAASTTDAWIKYLIYCKVQGTGTISGQTLVAEILETQFARLRYQRYTEEATATVTPSVSVASWYDIVNSPAVMLTAIFAALAVVIYVLAGKKPKRRRGRPKGSGKAKGKG